MPTTVGPTAMSTLSSPNAVASAGLGDVRLDLIVLLDDHELAAEHFHLAAGSRTPGPIIRPVWVCLP
jgi:hypothetical protein